MYHLIIRIEKDGKEIYESEKQLDLAYTKNENGIIAYFPHNPSEEEWLPATIDHAQDYLNSNPELWINEVPVNDDDTDPQGDR